MSDTNDSVDTTIELMERHRVVRFSLLTLLALVSLTSVWLVATNVFERFAAENNSELALAIATQQETKNSVETPVNVIESTEAASTAAPNDTRANAARIDMIGESVIDVAVGDSYTDDGALAFDAEGNELPLRTYVNGSLSEMVMLDTSSPDQHEVEYRAINGEGVITSVTRTIYVH